jgi:16S rRNA (uracil1498-N3)-methyltransferase
MQSRQLWLPSIAGVVPVRSLLGSTPVGPAGSVASAVALADMGGGPLASGIGSVLVGPEGGWSPEELALASDAGLPVVGLGPAVLRAETAAVAAGVLLVALREGLVGSL